MKQTIVSKVYNILRFKKIASLEEIYEYLPEHPKASIRGNINRHISKAANKLFDRKSKGVYCLTDLNELENESSKLIQIVNNDSKVYSIEKYLKSKLSIFNKKINNDELSEAVGFEQLNIFDSNIVDINVSYINSKETNCNNSVLKSSDKQVNKKKKTLSGAKLAGSNPKEKRAEHDYYATDPNTVELFLNAFHKDNKMEGSIWECACGEGNISKVLEKYYPNNEIVSTDLIDRGYGIGGIDFLTHNFKRKFDNIITNPPYKLMTEFITRALELANKFVIMFGNIQTLGAKARKELFTNSQLKYVYIHSDRQNTWKNGIPHKGNSTTFYSGWYVWDKTYKGEAIIRWI